MVNECERRQGDAHTNDGLGILGPGGSQAKLAEVLLGLGRERVQSGFGGLRGSMSAGELRAVIAQGWRRGCIYYHVERRRVVGSVGTA